MGNPVYEQIQARKVKAMLRMLQHAQRVSGNVSRFRSNPLAQTVVQRNRRSRMSSSCLLRENNGP